MYHFTIGVDKRVSCDTLDELNAALNGATTKTRAKPKADNPAVEIPTTDADKISRLPYEGTKMHWRTQKKLMNEFGYTDAAEFKRDMAARRKMGK